MAEETIQEQVNSVCEVSFSCHDPQYPFIKASEAEDCRIELAEMFPRPSGQYAEYFTITGADPVRIAAHGAEYDAVDVTVLSEYSNGGFVEFCVSGACPAFRLTQLGALPRTVRGDQGHGHITAEIPIENDVSEIVRRFVTEYPSFELVSKEQKESFRPRFTQSGFEELVYTHLTDRQREVLQTAFEEGYYDWPRESTGEDVATKLGITSPTFSEHIKAAERKLLSVLFTDPVSAESNNGA